MAQPATESCAAVLLHRVMEHDPRALGLGLLAAVLADAVAVIRLGRSRSPARASSAQATLARVRWNGWFGVIHLAAVAMISTKQARTRSARTHARTGGLFRSTHSFQNALCSSNSLMSDSQTWAIKSLDLPVPAVFGSRSTRSSTCLVCALILPTGFGVTPQR